MASLYKQGKVYWIQFYQGGKRFQESLKTKDYKTAKYLCAIKEADLTNSSAIIPTGKINANEALKRYNEFIKYSKTPKTIYNENIRIKSYLDFIKAESLNDINESTLYNYFNWRFEKKVNYRLLHPSGANFTIITLKFFLNWCVNQNFIAKNPLANVKLYKIDKTPKDFFSYEEIERILDVAKNEELYGMIATAYHTGMRKGELIRFKWMDIDYTNNLIMVKKSKTKNFRQIPLHNKLKAILQSLQKNAKPGINLFCFKCINERRVFKRIAEKAEVAPFGWHKFRHTFASHLVQKGVSLYKVSKYLGHSSITTTEIYAHLQPNTDKDIDLL